ncbi:hypothetical protein P692DRAFT_201872454 [Suillus brevipes Sb2]|nr:hypothetical protein P692DRAFT_201872454 [Suillus brevipes Sb2]
MSLSPSTKEYEMFMSTVQKPPEPEQSFEEMRVKDYIKTYTATGRPPAPVPDLPDSPNARHALGLPSLFSPIPIESTPSASSISITADKVITNPSDLLTIQHNLLLVYSHMSSSGLSDLIQQTRATHDWCRRVNISMFMINWPPTALYFLTILQEQQQCTQCSILPPKAGTGLVLSDHD